MSLDGRVHFTGCLPSVRLGPTRTARVERAQPSTGAPRAYASRTLPLLSVHLKLSVCGTGTSNWLLPAYASRSVVRRETGCPSPPCATSTPPLRCWLRSVLGLVPATHKGLITAFIAHGSHSDSSGATVPTHASVLCDGAEGLLLNQSSNWLMLVNADQVAFSRFGPLARCSSVLVIGWFASVDCPPLPLPHKKCARACRGHGTLWCLSTP